MSENLEPREQRMVDLCNQLLALDDYRGAYCYCHGDEFVIAAWGRQPADVFGLTKLAEEGMCVVWVYKYSPQYEQAFWIRTPISATLVDDWLINLTPIISQRVADAEKAGPPQGNVAQQGGYND